MNRRSTRKERFQKIYQAAEPLRVVKKNTIHTLAGIGRRHKFLRYPLLAGLVAFIFLYNLFLYIFIELKAEEKLAKGLAVLMTVVMVITGIDLTAFAMNQKETDYYRVTAIEAVDDSVTAAYGTKAEDIALPEYVTATLELCMTEEAAEEAVVEETAVTEEAATEEQEAAEGTVTDESVSSEESVTGETEAEEAAIEETVTEETAEQEAVQSEVVTAEVPVQWECAEYDSTVPGQYTFTATLSEEYDGRRLEVGDVVLPTITVDVKAPEDITLSETVDGIEITLSAAAGVFPSDARLSVTKIENKASLAKIESAIQESVDKASENDENGATVEETITFDITVLDSNGQEIQPQIPEGMSAQEAVTVTFKKVVSQLTEESEEDEETQQSMEVFYIDDAMETAQQMNASVQGEDLSINPEHFSLYSCTCTVYYPKTVTTWKELYKAVYGKTGTINIKLGCDITIDRMGIYSNSNRLYLKNGQTLNLNLNGYDLESDESGKPAIEVKSGTLNIHDTRGGGTISAWDGDSVIYADGGDVNLFGGTVKRGAYETYGIYVTNNSEISVKGGRIYGSFPYGIYFNSSYCGTGTLSSGAIDGANYGVYIGGSTYRGTTFVMSGGSILNCKNAGIYNNSGAVTMTGGTISGHSSYKAYGIRNTGAGRLKIGGAVYFSSNRAADIYVGNSSTNYINVTSALTGSKIGVETASAPTQATPVQFTSNATGIEKFYSAANSSYAVWQPIDQSYYVVGPKENCNIRVLPENKKVSTAEEEMAGTVAIGSGAASTTQINTTVKYNAPVTLKATLTNTEEYDFTGWKDRNGTIVCTTPVYTFTATNDNTYTAVFTKKQYTISTGTSNSARGSAAITSYSLGSASAGKYEVGSTVIIQATASSGYEFAQWNDGDTTATRTITVTGNATYTAQFKTPDPDPNATGELFVGVTKLTSNPAVGTKLLVIGGGGTMTVTGGMIAVAGLPDDSARVTAVSDGTYSRDWGTSSVVSGLSGSGGRQVTIQTKPDGSLYKGDAFDGCPGGLIRYNSSNGKWYYWCSGGACTGIGPYNVYSYSNYTTFKAGNVKASLNDLQLSEDQSSIAEADITITVGSYTLKSLIFKDTTIDYVNGDRRVELNLGGVLFTYTLPEAIVKKTDGTKTEYDTLEEAINAAEEGDKIYVVGSAVSEITNENTQLNPDVTIVSNDGTKITAGGEEPSTINASPDGTIELLEGQITAEPATDGSDVTVDVDGASVTAGEKITVTASGDGEDAKVTTTTPTTEVVISPDGDPSHTVTYKNCEEGKEYGIHSGKLTTEDEVEITSGTEYDLTVPLGEEEKTVATDSSNTGTTTIKKGTDETTGKENITISSDSPNDDITIGDTTYTTGDDNTKLVVTEDSDDVQLKEGSVQVPKDGTIVLPNGEKVTNSTPEGSEAVTADADGNKVTVPDGAEATIGEGDDAIKVSVPKGNPANLPAEVTPKEDGGVEVKAEPGNQVQIGDETYTIGDYDTTFEVAPGENGEPEVIVTDGGVELAPGQSVTDSNGVTFTNTGTDPIKLSMTEGENTEVSVGEGGSFEYEYQPEDAEEPVKNTYTNPGSSEADFSVSKEGDVALGSDMEIDPGKEVDVSFLGQDVNVKVPDTNQGPVEINNTEGTITIGEAGDKVLIDDKEYTVSQPETVLAPGKNGVELKDGGVTLSPKDSIFTNGTQIKNSGNGQCEVSLDEEGNTNIQVPGKGGFTMTDPDSGNSVSFTNPGTGDETYQLDDTGSLTLPDGSNITFKQGNTSTNIGTEGASTAIRPSENGVEITTPEGGTIKVNDVPFENLGDPGEELTITIGSTGKPVLESGTTKVPEGKQITLSGGDTVTSKKGDVTVGADGSLEMSQDSVLAIERDGKTSVYTAVTEPVKMELDPETGIPTLTEGSVKLAKDSAVDVIFNTVEHGEESELFDEVEKATITSKGTQAPTVNEDGTITVPKNGAVAIDSEVTKGTGESATKETAHNTVSVPSGAQNESVSVEPRTDGSADITLGTSGDKVVVNGMEYTTTKDNTQIHITETGSTLTQGAVALDGGKTPKEGINVNGTCVTNSGVAGTTVAVEAKGDGTIDFNVSGGAQFDLSVPGKPDSAVTFKNPSSEEASYTVETDGSIGLGADDAISIVTDSGDMEIIGNDGVFLNVTEDGAVLAVPSGKQVTVDGVTYESEEDLSLTITDKGVVLEIPSGKQVTVDGVTYEASGEEPLVLTVNHDKKPIITSGAATIPEGEAVHLEKENGQLLEIKKTGHNPELEDADSFTVAYDGESGKISAYSGDTLTIANGTYTCNDSDGTFEFSVNPDTGEITVEKGESFDITNGSLTFPDASDDITVSTSGNKTISVEKTSEDEKPVITVPAGGNVTVGNKTTGNEIEIKVPTTSGEGTKVTIDEDGNISAEMKAGEQITIGGVVYTAQQDGTVKVDGSNGELLENSITEEGSTLVPSIDPESFNKENYTYELEAGESVKVGDVTYTAPEGGMTLYGNDSGNPIIQVNHAGEKVQVGKQTYVTGSDNTKFIVNSDNNVTLVDNGNEDANSSLKVEGKKTITIDGNKISGEGKGYTITKTEKGDVLDIADGTKLTVNFGKDGSALYVKGQVSFEGKNTVKDSVQVKTATNGTGLVIDKTTKNISGKYVITLSTTDDTVVKAITDKNGTIIGFTTAQPPAPEPDTGNEDEPEESKNTETTNETQNVVSADNSASQSTVSNTKPKQNTTTKKTTTVEAVESTTNENKTTDAPKVVVNTLKEAAGVTVTENMKVQFGTGEVNLLVSSEAGSLTGDLENILRACFSADKLERIRAGENAEIRASVVKIIEDVPEEDAQTIQQELSNYAESIEGLMFGNYVDIVLECRVGEDEWEQIHELNGEVEFVLDVPQDLLKANREYYVLRNHEGVCTLLEDMDEDESTITIATDQFSTYAIFYRDVEPETVKQPQQNGVVPWILAGAMLILILAFGIRRIRRKR